MRLKRQVLSLGFLVYSMTLVASILSTEANAATYYISPAGSDSQSGISSSTPWKTFHFAIPKLRPGDTLLLLDGKYTKATSGMAQVTCGRNANNGTSSQPITIKAQHERQAHLQSDGSREALVLRTCTYWTIEGVHVSSADLPAAAGGANRAILAIYDSNAITVRRNLSHNNNRYFNTQCLLIAGTTNSLIEENEVYNCHRHGLSAAGGSSHNVIRRNYAHSRNYPDIPGGYLSPGTSGIGDEGISCYPCNNSIFENNISERFHLGFSIQATTKAINNRYLGNIALDDEIGTVFTARDDKGNSLDGMPQQTQLINFVSINSQGNGASFRTNKNTRCDNCTFIGNARGGFVADHYSVTNIGDNNPTVFGANILSVNNTGGGFRITGQKTAAFTHINSWNNGAADAFGNAQVTNKLSQDPQLGTCKVFIPTHSPMKGAGTQGQDIGANVLYRYQDGVLTKTPLWDPTTGQFPCGAQVAGVNNIAGSSCFDVHKRLNVNTNGCMLPPLGSSQPTSAFPRPTNLRVLGSQP